MVKSFLFYDGEGVVDGPDGENAREEEEDPIALGVAVLLVSNNPTGIQSEQRHINEGWWALGKESGGTFPICPLAVLCDGHTGRIPLRTMFSNAAENDRRVWRETDVVGGHRKAFVVRSRR